ncbi:MAG: hypothetical protein ACYC0U_01925 [Ilumatobacteraceae bacterium]
MKRRTLDIIFSAGALAVAILLVLLGFVFKTNADFADSYVSDQLSEQKINFTPAEFLSDEEKQSACLVNYAGTSLDSGKKAECYANEYIGLHLKNIAGGETYATLGAVQTKAKNAYADAVKANATNVDALKADMDKVTGQRDTMFKGETLRGLLLTSYGFSIFGEKAALAAFLAFIGAAILALAGLAGFVHAFSKSGNKVVLAPPA